MNHVANLSKNDIAKLLTDESNMFTESSCALAMELFSEDDSYELMFIDESELDTSIADSDMVKIILKGLGKVTASRRDEKATFEMSGGEILNYTLECTKYEDGHVVIGIGDGDEATEIYIFVVVS